MRGTNATTNAHGLPLSVPGTGMNGENTKELSTGAVLAVNKLLSPKTKPKIAPCFGPSISEPIITGICNVVARPKGRGIKPKNGIKVSKKIIAQNIASITIENVLFFVSIIFVIPSYFALPEFSGNR
jgi:hypothetical protein